MVPIFFVSFESDLLGPTGDREVRTWIWGRKRNINQVMMAEIAGLGGISRVAGHADGLAEAGGNQIIVAKLWTVLCFSCQ